MNYTKFKLLLFLGFSFQSAQGMYLGNTDKLPELPQKVLDRVETTKRIVLTQSIKLARTILPVVEAAPLPEVVIAGAGVAAATEVAITGVPVVGPVIAGVTTAIARSAAPSPVQSKLAMPSREQMQEEAVARIKAQEESRRQAEAGQSEEARARARQEEAQKVHEKFRASEEIRREAERCRQGALELMRK